MIKTANLDLNISIMSEVVHDNGKEYIIFFTHLLCHAKMLLQMIIIYYLSTINMYAYFGVL